MISTGLDPVLSRLICPITHMVMKCPVVAADGHTYERSAIEQWLRTSSSSPVTNMPLTNKTLLPNFALRSIIIEMRDRNVKAAAALANDRNAERPQGDPHGIPDDDDDNHYGNKQLVNDDDDE